MKRRHTPSCLHPAFPISSLFSLPLLGGPFPYFTLAVAHWRLGCHNTRLPRPRIKTNPPPSFLSLFLLPFSSFCTFSVSTCDKTKFLFLLTEKKPDDLCSIIRIHLPFLSQISQPPKCPARNTTTRAVPSTMAPRRPSRATPNTLSR